MKVKKRTATVTIRLEPELKQEILKFAYENNINITDVLEKAFIYYVKNFEQIARD